MLPLSELDDHELDLLVAFVLAGPDTLLTPSGWQKVASDMGVRDARGRRPSTRDLEPIAERLAVLKLVHRSPDSQFPSYAVSSDAAMRVLDHARHSGRLARLQAGERSRRVRISMMWREPQELGTELRLAVLAGDARAVLDVTDRAASRAGRDFGGWLVDALGSMPEPGWIAMLPRAAVHAYLEMMLTRAVFTLGPVQPELEDLAAEIGDKKLRLRLARIAAMRGDPEAPVDPKALPRWGAEGIAVLRAFFRGDFEGAAAIGDAACRAMTGRRHKMLSDLEGVCHLLSSAVCAATDPQRIDAIAHVLLSGPRDDHLRLVEVPLFAIHHALAGLGEAAKPMCLGVPALAGPWTSALLRLLNDLWLDPGQSGPARRLEEHRASITRDARATADAWKACAEMGGYLPIARELQAIADAFEGKAVEPGRLAGAFRVPQAWEAALSRLEALAESSAAGTDAHASGTSLVWEVAVHSWGAQVKPRIRIGPRAKKGTAVSVDRLYDELEAQSLDAHDRRAAAAWLGGHTREPFGDFDHEGDLGERYDVPPGYTTLAALVGHPRAVDEGGAPITVARGVATLRTNRVSDGTRVELHPPDLIRQPLAIERPTPDRIVVYERGAKLDPLAEILARAEGLQVPQPATDRLARALVRVAVTAGIQVEGDVSVDADLVDADGRIVLQLGWTGETLSVRASVAPLGLHGPHVRPGAGAATIVGEIGAAPTADPAVGVFKRCHRDLAAERTAITAVLDACPTLASFSSGNLSWSVSALSDALDVMAELDTHVRAHEDAVVLAWETGKRLHPPRSVEIDALKLAVTGRSDWLDIDAKLCVDDDTVLGFRALLAAREGPRFVALGRDRFVALSERLRRQLDALADLGSLQGDDLQVSSVALARLDELLEGVGDVSWDHDARAKLERLREASALQPRVPRSLGATLRDYQRDGFVWMSRLASADLGACLADDMGLGKTVQAIAILCQRATLGPALVVCPTSVVGNWMQEIDRFAPGLRPATLATATDRAGLLAELRTRDVVVCSYALLVSEADALAEVELATVVFDEAHALKNDQTKRAIAARSLKARFKIGLSGTPVENRISELWSLFAVLVPGLLGSKAQFEARFGVPIVQGDRERAAHLRALIKPFVLRRTKSQVLDELPPRTEVTLEIEPSAPERDFYEAVRLRALDKVAAGDPKKKRFRLLAQITKLRQAAVDPRLIDPVAPAGTKIETLARKLVDLRDEGHRALVFTQFLGSMAAVRERLAKDAFEVLELDGSTPAAERSRRIDAFQAGEADVFLLSLRAGGIGVNLTAADYVFHLDPWWNPAVEDQATDRAHRIGQTRPVTVYRLVTKGTIEQKILELHASKRALAEDLLTGMEGGGALDLDELTALLEG